MKGIKVNIKRMMADSKVTTIQELSDLLYVREVIEIHARSLYRWQAGHNLSIPLFVEVAEALGYENPVELLSYGEIKWRASKNEGTDSSEI